MTAEQTQSTSEEQGQVIQDHLRLLLRELCTFANNNPRFRRGESDYVYISVIEGDQVVPSWEAEEDEVDDDDGTDIPTVPGIDCQYRFEAQRYRYFTDSAEQRASIIFQFGVVGTLRGTLLPPHIAEDQLGLPAEEAVREMGAVELVREQRYTFSTRERLFSLCESYQYLGNDEEDKVISEVCSCTPEDEGIMYVADAETTEEVERLLELDVKGVITQYPATDIQERDADEPVVLDDVEVAAKEWSSLSAIGEEIEQYEQLEQILSARTVLRNIQTALRTQLGLQ